jgi:uncharacterized membrane protein
MFRFSHKTLYVLSGIVWLSVGLMLLNTGLVLIMSGFQSSQFFSDGYSSFFPWLASLCAGPDNAAVILIGLGLVMGFFKGRFVLQKAAHKSFTRISQLDNPTHISNLYTKSNFVLIALMIAMGMSMRYFGMPFDIRGWIDVAVGSALTQGSVAYFQFASFTGKQAA